MLTVRFFGNPSGREPVREFLRALGKKDRAKAGALIQELQNSGHLEFPKSRHLGKGLWEIRFIGEQGYIRILYCVHSQRTICLLHGLVKKSAKTPRGDLHLAQERKRILESTHDN